MHHKAATGALACPRFAGVLEGDLEGTTRKGRREGDATLHLKGRLPFDLKMNSDTTIVFALATRTGGLRAFVSAPEAVSHCDEFAARNASWLFFADDGSPLEARFARPGTPAAAGPYVLQRALSGRWLQERLDQVRTIRGCGLATVAELVEILKVNRGRRVAADLGGGRPAPDKTRPKS